MGGRPHPKARHIYLPEVCDRMGELDRDRPVVRRSTGSVAIAASLLQANGFREYQRSGQHEGVAAAGIRSTVTHQGVRRLRDVRPAQRWGAGLRKGCGEQRRGGH